MDALRTVLRVACLMSRRDRARWLRTISISGLSGLLEMVSVWAVFIMVAVVVQSGSTTPMPWIEEGLGLAERLPLVAVLAAVATLFAIKTVVALAAVHTGNRFLNQAQARLAGQLFSAYLAAPLRFHLERDSVDKAHSLIQRVTVAFKEVAHEALVLTNNGVVAVAILVVVFVSDWRAAAVATLFVVITLGLLSLFTRMKLVRLGRRRDTAARDALLTAMTSFRAMEEIKVLGRERHFVAMFEAAQSNQLSANYKIETLLTLPRILGETLFLLALLVVVAFVLGGEESNRALLPLLGVYAYAGLRLMPIANRTTENIQRIRSAGPTIDALEEQFAELGIAGKAQNSLPVTIAMEREIVLAGVSLVYSPETRSVLRDLDLTLHRGEWLGLVGDTGAGKTSIIYLLLGLLKPSAGRVLLDGQDLHAGGGRHKVKAGYVPQQGYLMNDTIRRNIAFGFADEDIDDQRIQSVVSTAQLEGFVARLAQGLESRVGEDATRISGGERQRLALARALYDQSDLLILDEATSALDVQTEAAILTALRTAHPHITVVLVTHRIATAECCDRLVCLREGEIAAQGSFDELLRDNSYFRALADSTALDPGRSPPSPR